ncbi:hypothetical protein Bca52824_025433 [Brassica carinata]|uniref:Transmembrane 9 superfamily member n=1 Tax=Brassica carinata TaxID=52824 RepID=A0A8X7V6Y2_BRACI|nr:hypothetical protein Bca52824_025433 [Brassica carinata]
MYHRDLESDSARIVGFEVTPKSNPQLTTCNKDTKNLIQSNTAPQEVEQGKEIVFTYDVSFKESEIKWASRWDTYLLMNDDQIHWFSIINSLMIVLFLSGMVAMIMMRTLYKDISNYNQLETQDEAQEETGWKLVHGDVFRPPVNSGCCVFTLAQRRAYDRHGSLVGFHGHIRWLLIISPSQNVQRKQVEENDIEDCIHVSRYPFAIFFVLNGLIWESSRLEPYLLRSAPVKTNKIPRQVPEQPWYMKPVFSILIGGVLPFGAVFIELFFILTSIWLNQFYYIFGFLFIVFLILIVTRAEITVVLCYFQLCSEDYNWWWRAYLTAGSSAFYLFLYSIFYFTAGDHKAGLGMLYWYMIIISYAFFVLTGTIGFYACFWFVRKIYSSVKID